MQYNETVHNAEDLIQKTFIVAHEIAHQWFGNYATLRLWDYIWLKEGSCRYFECEMTAKGKKIIKFMRKNIFCY